MTAATAGTALAGLHTFPGHLVGPLAARGVRTVGDLLREADALLAAPVPGLPESRVAGRREAAALVAWAAVRCRAALWRDCAAAAGVACRAAGLEG